MSNYKNNRKKITPLSGKERSNKYKRDSYLHKKLTFKVNQDIIEYVIFPVYASVCLVFILKYNLFFLLPFYFLGVSILLKKFI